MAFLVKLLCSALAGCEPYAADMKKPDWGFAVAALVAGLLALAVFVLLVMGLRGLL